MRKLKFFFAAFALFLAVSLFWGTGIDANAASDLYYLGGMTAGFSLSAGGAEVIAVDINEDIVNDAISDIPYCKCADITNPEVIRRLGIANVDVAVIAMASSLESSIMATMFCKEIGVKTVIVKCANETNGKILSKVGADRKGIGNQNGQEPFKLRFCGYCGAFQGRVHDRTGSQAGMGWEKSDRAQSQEEIFPEYRGDHGGRQRHRQY